MRRRPAGRSAITRCSVRVILRHTRSSAPRDRLLRLSFRTGSRVTVPVRKHRRRDPVDLGRRESQPEHVIEEEIVKLVGPHEILGLLGDLALRRREQLRRHRRRENIQQRPAQRRIPAGIRVVADQMTHQCLRHRSVHRVHRHMVAVVGRPSQRQLRQIAGADHKAA